MAVVASIAGTWAGSGSAAPVTIGYVPYWDQERGFAVVHRYRHAFDQISPMWYAPNASGDVVPSDDTYTDIALGEVRYLQGHGIRVVPTLVDMRNGAWRPDLVSSMLSSAASRRHHVSAIVEMVLKNGYDGVDIDYEDLHAADRNSYSAFLQTLGTALRNRGKLLTSSVYAKQSEPGPYDHSIAQDYAAIGMACDQVRVMTYDHSTAGSPPGPVAPLSWVHDTIAWAVTAVPSSNVFLGIELLGYDWPAGEQGETVTYRQAIDTATRRGARILRAADGSPHYSYVDEASGTEHEVWFEDAASTKQKLALVGGFGLGGAFFWRLGGADPKTWDLVN